MKTTSAKTTTAVVDTTTTTTARPPDVPGKQNFEGLRTDQRRAQVTVMQELPPRSMRHTNYRIQEAQETFRDKKQASSTLGCIYHFCNTVDAAVMRPCRGLYANVTLIFKLMGDNGCIINFHLRPVQSTNKAKHWWVVKCGFSTAREFHGGAKEAIEAHAVRERWNQERLELEQRAGLGFGACYGEAQR
ncbi:uncharacterized protein LOC142558383 [Dermacentor variabilis]|uniref:uncharacterized protein LOC142558383 n=1 Tax=Dermacentor variabilis TaxID=34621 RepID=UPI003F5C63F0